MQHYLKKYFWLVSAVTVIICAIFGAAAVNHFVEGKYFAPSSTSPRVMPIASASAEPAKTRSKGGQPLSDRNMFCSDCAPPEPVAAPVGGTDPDMVPYTMLPLHLVATNVSTRPEWSFATIRNSTSEVQGAYWLNKEIPDAGVVTRITGKFVDFKNKTGGLERIALIPGDGPRPPITRPAEVASVDETPAENKDDIAAAIDSGVKQIDESHYEIDRALVDKLLSNPMSVARGARIVPSVKNGEANGFKLYAIRPSSVYAKLGMANGDTVHSVNGFDLTTPDKALEVYTKVRESTSLEVSITRRGKPVTISYTIR